MFLCQLAEDDRIGYDDSEEMILEAISVDEDLCDDGADGVCVLDLFEGDVFALGELHDVL